MCLRNLLQHFQVQWFGPTHVDHCCVHGFRRLQPFIEQGTEGQNGKTFSLTPYFCFGKRQGIQVFAHCSPYASPPGVPHRHGMILQISSAQQLTALIFICGARNAHIGNTSRKSNVKHARMRGAIGSHQSSAV